MALLRWRAWLLLAALLVARHVRAQPSPTRVVAAFADARLVDAVTMALASWHVDVASRAGAVPGRDLDDAILTAHRIARGEHARAVVWISHDPRSGADSLWVYDDGTRAIVVRPLVSGPPYDDETAAAIALTVKTVLHDAFESPPHAPHLQEEESPLPVVHPTASKPRHTVRLMMLGGARVPTNASDVAAARFGAEATYFPAIFDQRLGLAVGVDLGPNVLVEHAPYIIGTSSDTVATAALKWRIPLRRWFSFELGAGPGVHFSALEGSSPAAGLSGRVARIDASLETSIVIEFAWKILRVAPLVGTSFRAHYQHYQVDNVQVFDVPANQMFFALRVGVEVP